MTIKSSTRRTRWTMSLMVAGLAITAAACFTPPAPPKSTTTTTHPATTTTTLPATTTTTVASTTTTTLAPCQSGTTSITPNPIPKPTGTRVNVSVCYSGLAANQLLFVEVCQKSPDTAGFDPIGDCSGASENTINPVDNATGTGTFTYRLFYGAEPSGDDAWGCFKPGDTPPGGVTALSTCYLRITSDSETNTLGDQGIAYSFS